MSYRRPRFSVSCGVTWKSSCTYPAKNQASLDQESTCLWLETVMERTMPGVWNPCGYRPLVLFTITDGSSKKAIWPGEKTIRFA